MNRSVNWLAWTLQFVVGLIVGAILGIKFVSEAETMSFKNLSMLIVGTAFLGGALASFLGDRLWIGDNYRMIPPDEPKHNQTSTLCSFIAGGLGSGLIFLSLCHHLKFF